VGATLTPAHPDAHAAPAVEAESTRGCLGRILAAEDNTVNKMVIVRLLKKAAYDVDVVDNGAQAVEAVARQHYDAILMDCRMPVMDGFEATAAIRKAESGTDRHLPIIALTASAMDADRERCLASGMDAFLTKPIKQGDLVEMLDRWVLREPEAAPATRAAAPATALLAEQLEIGGRSSQLEGLGPVVEQFDREMARLFQWVETRLTTPAPGKTIAPETA